MSTLEKTHYIAGAEFVHCRQHY